MSKRLPNSEALTIDRYGDQPATAPLETGHCPMLELSVTVWTDDQQVTGVMADPRVKMVYFKVGSPFRVSKVKEQS